MHNLSRLPRPLCSWQRSPNPGHSRSHGFPLTYRPSLPLGHRQPRNPIAPHGNPHPLGKSHGVFSYRHLAAHPMHGGFVLRSLGLAPAATDPAPGNDSVDVTYRFGSTQGGLRDPHHGVEFLNSFGTPVVAAGEGVVVVAGSDRDPISPPGDWPILFYGPYANFYGNLVVIEHSPPAALFALYPDLPTPLYTLYGHLSEVLVQVGQTVQAGQLIGRVGMSGVATGNHLHFEVRLGENTYKAAHNPELWLAPHTDAQGQPTGALAGRFLNTYQVSLEIEEIVLEYLPQGPEGESAFEIALRTYEEKALLGRPPFWESFGVGDLPAGLYRLTFPLNGLRREWITIYPGQITVVTFRK